MTKKFINQNKLLGVRSKQRKQDIEKEWEDQPEYLKQADIRAIHVALFGVALGTLIILITVFGLLGL